ncbi:MAG: hypothetical protein HC812_11260 [Leptolyngbya sp. RL_3_1]|nr:hypothetical protein [Leptolyngbya sp. RL_3_1]
MMQHWTRLYGWFGLLALTVTMAGSLPTGAEAALQFEAASERPTLISRGQGRNHHYRGTGRRELIASGRGSGRIVA